MVPIDTDEALAELKAGRIDAMFFVAGYPVRLLSEGVTAADDLTLVPITNKDIAEFYPRVTIPGGHVRPGSRNRFESVTVKGPSSSRSTIVASTARTVGKVRPSSCSTKPSRRW